MGDAEQLRDKHYVMAIGGRADIYIKSFSAMPVITLRKTATKVDNGTYSFTIQNNEIPGYYAIRAITNVDTILDSGVQFGSLAVLGSYAFTELRTADITGTTHDFDVSQNYIETAYSSYQTSVVTVTGLEGTTSANTYELKVEVYVAPLVKEVQDYIDQSTVLNLFADLVVRCPVACMVTANITAYQPASIAKYDPQELGQTVVDYINSTSFGHVLSTSQIIASLSSKYNITRIDMSASQSGLAISGSLRAADGSMLALSGGELNVASIQTPSLLVTPNTVLFSANPRDIHVTVVQE
jgi:hypothetical protein